jgi:hypothetical protein
VDRQPADDEHGGSEKKDDKPGRAGKKLGDNETQYPPIDSIAP